MVCVFVRPAGAVSVSGPFHLRVRSAYLRPVCGPPCEGFLRFYARFAGIFWRIIMFKPTFINLTPHSIFVTIHPDFLDDRGLEYPASGQVARMAANRAEGQLCGPHRMIQQSFGAVEGLPDPVAGVIYIVSNIILNELAGSRPDVVAPDMGPDAIRNNGQIVAVRGFVC